ncbi:hypothetical protein [Azospirillum largimobile]
MTGSQVSSILISLEGQKSAASGGIEIIGARIEGPISLCGSLIKERIVFRDCHFLIDLDEHKSCCAIDIVDSRLYTIEFFGCVIDFIGENHENVNLISINMERANLDGSFLFVNSTSSAAICAIGSNIKGDFNLHGSRINDKFGLVADRIRVGGQVFLRSGFHCDGGIVLRSAQIDSNIDLSNSIIGKESRSSPAVSLEGASIGGFCSFYNSKVSTSGPISIDADSSTIRTWVNVSGTFKSRGGVRFRAAQIGANFNADGGYFRIGKNHMSTPAVDLEAAAISGSVFFRDSALIIGQIKLLGTKIANNLVFDNFRIANPGSVAIRAELSHIGGHVYIRGGQAKMDERHKMRSSSIRGGVNFMAASVGGSFRIYFTRIINADSGEEDSPQRVLFNRIRISGTLSIRRTKFSAPKQGDRPADVRFINAKVYALVDDRESWPEPGCLVLDGFEYERITRQDTINKNVANEKNLTLWEERLAWLCRQKSKHLGKEFRPQPFNQLINVLKRMGHDDDARQIAIQKQKFSRLSRPVIKRLPSYFMEVSCGHGYRPWLALIWMAVLITLGGALFDYTRNHFTPMRNNVTAGENAFNPWLYSADTFIPIINLQQKDRWTPITELSNACESDERRYWALIAWVYRPFHTIFGWFFATLFVAGVSGLIRKD